MKIHSLLPLVLLFAATTAARAGIVYSGIRDVPIPVNFTGVYFRLDTGLTSLTAPSDYNTAPWLNPFFGGTGIGNGALLRPLITGADQILNLAAGAPIGSTGNFTAGASGSSTHVGIGAGQFVLDRPGYIGVKFRSTPTGLDYYGWVNVELHNSTPGRIISWAYNDVPGAALAAGAIPEPGTACFGLGLILAGLSRRARR